MMVLIILLSNFHENKLGKNIYFLKNGEMKHLVQKYILKSN